MTADHLGNIPYEAPGMGFGLGFQVRREGGLPGCRDRWGSTAGR